MVNGTLIARTSDGSPTRLRIYDVTRLIRPGPNTVAVRLARPLASGNLQADRYPSKLLLDGWAETDRGELAAVMQTDRTRLAFITAASSPRSVSAQPSRSSLDG